MKRKFTRVALFAAMTFAISASFVGCKDYDDDIDALNNKVTGIEKSISDIEAAMQSGKSITGYVPTADGYELSLSDGTKLTIKNGTNGENGKTFIPTFRVSSENCWQVSTDDGATWVDVLNEAGEKVIAVGGSNVTINKDGFIVIGDVVTTLKTNTAVPSIIVNELDGLYIFNINGKEYKVLAEGSAYNGLQSVTYRRKSANDALDFVESLRLYTLDKESKDVELMQSVASATFKIWPKTMDLAKATYEFTDTYKTRAAKEPALSYVAESAKWVDDKNGILSVAIKPGNIMKGKEYASSLDVTINGHTTASDYFNFRARDLNVNELSFVHVNDSSYVPCGILVDELNTWEYPKYSFVYDKSYSLPDSVALGTNYGEFFLSMADLGFQGVKVSFAQTPKKVKGIFDINKETGVVTVKAENQASAINEVCFVTATYSTPDNKVIRTYDFAVKAIREQIAVETNDVAVKVLDPKINLSNLAYSNAEQKIKLDVRHFENEIGGRDYMSQNNYVYDEYYALFYYSTKVEADKKEHKYVNKVPAYLHFHAGENTDKDYLELIIPAGTIINPAQELFAMQSTRTEGGYWPYSDVVDYTDNTYFEQNLANNRISTGTYEINGKRIKYTLKLNDKVKVSRDVIIKQNTAFIVDGKTTVVGEWNESAKSFTMVGNLEDLYAAYKADGKTKSDEEVTYILAPKANQSAAVQKVYAQMKIENNKLYVDPKVDIATLGSINISANIKGTEIAAVMQDKDGNVVEYATPVLRSPINDWVVTTPITWAISGVATTYNVAEKAKASINDRDINVVDSKTGKIVGNTLVKDGAVQNWAAAYAGVVSYKIKGYSETVNEGTFTIDATTGVLTCNNINIASALDITVTVTLTHNWGTVAKDIVVKAALNN